MSEASGRPSGRVESGSPFPAYFRLRRQRLTHFSPLIRSYGSAAGAAYVVSLSARSCTISDACGS
jgi:hypothetical protein